MTHLHLNDYIFDVRRAVYIKSIKALVIGHLGDSLLGGFSGKHLIRASSPTVKQSQRIGVSVRSHLMYLSQLLEEYTPSTLLLLGGPVYQSLIDALTRRINRKKIVWITSKNTTNEWPNHPKTNQQALLDTCEIEHHTELLWNQYRFTADQGIDFTPPRNDMVEVTCASSFQLMLGTPIGTAHTLPVFLKSPQKLFIPSFGDTGLAASIYQKEFMRFDVFAIGHARILPLGKVSDLHSDKNVFGKLPFRAIKHSVRTKHETPELNS